MLRLTPVLPQMASHCWFFCLAWVLRDRHNQIRSRFLATDSGQGSVEQHNKTLLWLSVVWCVMVLCAQCKVSLSLIFTSGGRDDISRGGVQRSVEAGAACSPFSVLFYAFVEFGVLASGRAKPVSH